MKFFANETLVDSSIEGEGNGVGNFDLISILLVFFLVFVCLVVCCVVRKRTKTNIQQNHHADAIDDIDLAPPGTDSNQHAPILDHYTALNTVPAVVDRGILRGGPSTPESPPPSYYGPGRGDSFQSFSSHTSSQYEVPPPYDDSFKGRVSLATHSIPEEGDVCEGVPEISEGGGGGMVGGGGEMGGGGGGKKTRKSTSVSSRSFGKEKKKRKTKSDLIREKKNRVSTPTTTTTSNDNNNTNNNNDNNDNNNEATATKHIREESSECLLRNEGGERGVDEVGVAIGSGEVRVKKGEMGKIGVSVPTRFNKKDSQSYSFTPV